MDQITGIVEVWVAEQHVQTDVVMLMDHEMLPLLRLSIVPMHLLLLEGVVEVKIVLEQRHSGGRSGGRRRRTGRGRRRGGRG